MKFSCCCGCSFVTSHPVLFIHKVMVKTCISLLTKVRCDMRDTLLALHEWCNASTECMNDSLVWLLYGRQTRTCPPVAKELFTPRCSQECDCYTRRNNHWGELLKRRWTIPTFFCEPRLLSSEPQMVEISTRGVGGDKTLADRAYWTGWVKPN